MSKLSFRARALDPSKPMPIYLAEELPDLPEYSAINRAVPQMPSGMEKEEESEHHLQRAICTGLIIPTPEVFPTDRDYYERVYPANYKMPRQLIRMQPLGLEQDIPDYDMDSADEVWVNLQSKRLDLTPLKFEQMMDKLEKSSGQTVVTLNEAKALLKQDDEISIAVYDYWLNKRLKTQHPLILSVKTENRSGQATNNPYLAFRRRTEKMQTRKNRKNDETSYEKMLKLRRDLSRAVTLLEMVKRREKAKREHLHLTIEIFEKRYQARDFSGSLLAELNSNIRSSRPAFAPIYSNQYSHHSSLSQLTTSSSLTGNNMQNSSGGVGSGRNFSTSQYLSSTGLLSGNSVPGTGVSSNKRDFDSSAVGGINNNINVRREKRQYKKRKHKIQREKHYTHHLQNSSPAAVESNLESDEDDIVDTEDDGPYAFRRNKNCEYHRPLVNYGNWPWESTEENGLGENKYRFALTSIKHPRPRCIGFARRRLGRGGRIILDRVSTNLDDLWSQWDYTIFKNDTQSEKTDKLNILPLVNKKIMSNSQNNCSILNNNNYKLHLNNLSPTFTSSSSTNLTTTGTKLITVQTLGIPSKEDADISDNINDNDFLIKNYFNQLNVDEEDSSDYNISSDEFSNEENISRDSNYISSSSEPIRKCPTIIDKKISKNNIKLNNNNNSNNINNVYSKLKTKKLKMFNMYKNSLLFKNNYENSINNISNYLLNKKVKREQNFCNGNLIENYVDDESTTLSSTKEGVNGINNNGSSNSMKSIIDNTSLKVSTHNKNYNQHKVTTTSTTTSTTILTTSQFVSENTVAANSLVRHNSNSNVNIKNNYSFSNSVNLNNRNLNKISNNNTVNDKFNVIKQELLSEDDTTMASANSSCGIADNSNDISDDENVNLARLSSYINAANKQQHKNTLTTTEETLSSELYRTNNNSNNSYNSNSNINSSSNINNRSISTFDLLKSQCTPVSSNLLVNRQQQKNNINNNNCTNNAKLFRGSSLPKDAQKDHSYHNSSSKGYYKSNNNNEQNEQRRSEIVEEPIQKSIENLNNITELFNEIQRDWLHFRPKTPPLLEIENEINNDSSIDESIVQFSETTPITVELLNLINKNNPPLLSSHVKQNQPLSVFSAPKSPCSTNTLENKNQLHYRNASNNDNNVLKSAHKTRAKPASRINLLSKNLNIEDNELIMQQKNVLPILKNPQALMSTTFMYTDLQSDDYLLASQLNSVVSPNFFNSGNGTNEKDNLGNGTSSSNQIDFGNLSGDSLTELNLSLGEDDNEKILDNILQECQIDDIRALNQTTNFWNGILEDNGNLLDVIDEKKSLMEINSKVGYPSDFLNINNFKQDKENKKDIPFTIGCSQFSVENYTSDGKFFKKFEPKIENESNMDTIIKIEPPDEILASPPPPPLCAINQTVTATSSYSQTSDVSQSSQQNLLQSTNAIHQANGSTNPLINPNVSTLSSISPKPQLCSQTTSMQTFLGENQQLKQPNTPLNHNLNFSNSTDTSLSQVSHITNKQQSVDFQQQTRTSNVTLIPSTTVYSTISSLNQNQTTSIACSGTNVSNMTIGQIGNQKFFIKQEPITTSNQIQVPSYNQSQIQHQQSNSAVITLANIKLENDIVSGIATGANTVSNFATQSTNTALISDTGGGLCNTTATQSQQQSQTLQQQGNIILTSSKAIQSQQSQPQHILLQQISGQNPQTQIINVSSAGGITVTDAQGGTIVLAGSSPNKRQINGPADRNTIQNILKQTKFINNRKFQISHQAQQFQTVKQEDDIAVATPGGQKSALQSLQTGNYIKMGSYPVVVSDLNVQQTNSLSAVANHNYSLQPTDDQRLVNNRLQPITIIGQQQSGNKIILNTNTSTGAGNANSSSSTTGGNFTITTPIQDVQNKINYTQIPTSNIKVNLVTSSGIQQGNLMVSSTGGSGSNSNSIQNSNHSIETKNTELLNKNVTVQHHTLHLQQQQQIQQRIKLEKALSMYIDSDQKKVLYTKLVNFSSLHQQAQQSQQHKQNNVGVVQQNQASNTVQLTPQMLANKAAQNVQRLTNTQTAIVANMRMSVGTNQLQVGNSGNITTASNSNASNSATVQQQQIQHGNSSVTVDNITSSSSSTGGITGNMTSSSIKQQQTESAISTTNR